MTTQSVETRRTPARTVLVATGMASLAWIAGGFASFTWQATACVAFGGVTVVILGLRSTPKHGRNHERPRGISAWVIWAVAFVCLWGSAFLAGSRPSYPTLSLLLDPALELHPVKAAAFLAWLLGGWMLVRR